MQGKGHAVLQTRYIMFYINSYFNTQANVKPAERLTRQFRLLFNLCHEASSAMENKSHGMLEFRT